MCETFCRTDISPSSVLVSDFYLNLSSRNSLVLSIEMMQVLRRKKNHAAVSGSVVMPLFLALFPEVTHGHITVHL